MADGPYTFFRRISGPTAVGPDQTIRYEIELADIANVSAQRERLTILTHVPLPLPDGLQAMQVAALQHVRDLVAAQIVAIQSA
jgi:hypothetical protein